VCHYRHHVHGNPYAYLGLQDITAHVDFSAAARAGQAAGLELAGFTTQAHFLLALGMEELLAELLSGAECGTRGGVNLLLGAKQLVLPSAMGERFRVLGLAKSLRPDQGPWQGFSLRDLRGRL
jgi:SAM-dependent MidA family methyltransferase